MCLVEIRLHPDDFWSRTPAEINYMAEYKANAQYYEWDRTRYLATMMLNTAMTKGKKTWKPKDLFELPTDKREPVELPTKEEFKQSVLRYSKFIN